MNLQLRTIEINGQAGRWSTFVKLSDNNVGSGSRRYANRIRQAVLEKFGVKCNKCGFSDWRALQIDHVNSGGLEERKQYKNRTKYHRAVLADATGKYQLLCANCNQIKKYTNNEFSSGNSPGRPKTKDYILPENFKEYRRRYALSRKYKTPLILDDLRANAITNKNNMEVG